MELQENSLAIKLYNGCIWLRNRLFNFAVLDEDDFYPLRRSHFESDEEYKDALALSASRRRLRNGFLDNSSNIDLCTLVRRYVWGAMMVGVYAFFYTFLFYTLIWYNISNFGVGYAMIGFGWVLVVLTAVAMIVAAVLGIIYVSSETPVFTVVKDAVTNAVTKSSILHVIIERWKSFKDKTCVLIRVKGE